MLAFMEDSKIFVNLTSYLVVVMMVEFEDGNGWMFWKQIRIVCHKVIYIKLMLKV